MEKDLSAQTEQRNYLSKKKMKDKKLVKNKNIIISISNLTRRAAILAQAVEVNFRQIVTSKVMIVIIMKLKIMNYWH